MLRTIILALKKYNLLYDLTQCQLYKLSSKKKLVSLLNLSSYAELTAILSVDNLYRVFPLGCKAKSRIVQVPSLRLLPLHNRIFTLLNKVKKPDYLHSGTKGRSHITNAVVHCGSKEAYTIDIQKFYPSVTKDKVIKFFRNTLKCEPDIAVILANISTYDGHIPTGSSISQMLAYFSCKNMFDALFDVSHEANLKFTCFVDDLTFSGEKVSKAWIYDVAKPIITNSKMKSHKDKHFRPGQPKEITGVIVDGDAIKVCNRMHRSIHELTLQIAETENAYQLADLYDSLVGKLCAAGQIEGHFKDQRIMVTKTRRRLNLPRRPQKTVTPCRLRTKPIVPLIDHTDTSCPWAE